MSTGLHPQSIWHSIHAESILTALPRWHAWPGSSLSRAWKDWYSIAVVHLLNKIINTGYCYRLVQWVYINEFGLKAIPLALRSVVFIVCRKTDRRGWRWKQSIDEYAIAFFRITFKWMKIIWRRYWFWYHSLVACSASRCLILRLETNAGLPT